MASEIDRIDEEMRQLVARREEALAKARWAEERKDREAAKILVGSTPKKEKKEQVSMPDRPKQPVFASAAQLLPKVRPPKQELPTLPRDATAGPSRMSDKLAALRRASSDSRSPSTAVGRSGSSSSKVPVRNATAGPSSQQQRPRPATARVAHKEDEHLGVDTPEESAGERNPGGVKRDEDSLIVIEDLPLGPKDFGRDPDGDFGWERMEPYSRLRLSKRVMAYPTVQDRMYGRYYLSPSMMYSLIRLSRDGATYDIPVEGEWVTVAVVAERGEVRMSGYKDASDSESDGGEGGAVKKSHPNTAGGPGGAAKSTKKGQTPRKRRAKKYINLKLAALPTRSSSSAGSGVAGDALLQLLLFESDHVVRHPAGTGEEARVEYKGGSGGAYEKWCNLNPGDVVGLVSPKILRPLKSGSNAPHPLTLPLALNPYSAESVFLIGKCRDLGQCTAIQKDGNRCTSWVDTRQNTVCEYHVHLAIQRQKVGRAEFASSTAPFALQTRTKGAARGGFGGGSGKTGINHQTKTGLLPAAGPQAAPRGLENGGGGVTYVVGGGVIRSGGGKEGLKGWGDEHLSEKLGRGRAEKRRKRMSEQEAEEALNKLVGQKQGVGGQYLAAAARHRKAQEEAAADEAGVSRKKGKAASREAVDEEVDENVRKAFSADSIKKIGFDPTNLSSNPRYTGADEKKRKADAISSLKTSRREFDPDARYKRVNVRAPAQLPVPTVGDSAAIVTEAEEGMIDLD